MLAYVTNQRVPEIGVRMALGAGARDVMRLVFGQSLRMIFAGAALGVVAAYVAARILERLVEGVRGADPQTFVAMIAVLIVAALCASWIRPAARAASIRSARCASSNAQTTNWMPCASGSCVDQLIVFVCRRM